MAATDTTQITKVGDKLTITMTDTSQFCYNGTPQTFEAVGGGAFTPTTAQTECAQACWAALGVIKS